MLGAVLAGSFRSLEQTLHFLSIGIVITDFVDPKNRLSGNTNSRHQSNSLAGTQYTAAAGRLYQQLHSQLASWERSQLDNSECSKLVSSERSQLGRLEHYTIYNPARGRARCL